MTDTNREIIKTSEAPAAIGPYSQAVRVGKTVYLSGQIALDPGTGVLVEGGVEEQAERAFANLEAVVRAAGGKWSQVVKLTFYLTDLSQFAAVNTLMERRFEPPYPARVTVGVAALPRGAAFEVEAVLVLD